MTNKPMSAVHCAIVNDQSSNMEVAYILRQYAEVSHVRQDMGKIGMAALEQAIARLGSAQVQQAANVGDAKLREALEAFENRMKDIGGCPDGYCLVTGPAKGMHTNGGCNCYHNRMTAQRIFGAVRTLRNALVSAPVKDVQGEAHHASEATEEDVQALDAVVAAQTTASDADVAKQIHQYYLKAGNNLPGSHSHTVLEIIAAHRQAALAERDAQIERLVGALEFYADADCYNPQYRECPVRGSIQLQSDIQRDNHGDKARAALVAHKGG